MKNGIASDGFHSEMVEVAREKALTGVVYFNLGALAIVGLFLAASGFQSQFGYLIWMAVGGIAAQAVMLIRPIPLAVRAFPFVATFCGIVAEVIALGPSSGSVSVSFVLVAFAGLSYGRKGAVGALVWVGACTVYHAWDFLTCGASTDWVAPTPADPLAWVRAYFVLILGLGGVIVGIATFAKSLLDAASQSARAALALEEEVKARKLAEAKLRETAATEATAAVAGGVAHDLNNALTVIMGEGSLVSTSDDPVLREGATRVLKAAQEAAILSNHLLVFARRELEARELVDVMTVFEESCALAGHVMGGLEWKVTGAHGHVESARFRQLTMSLLFASDEVRCEDTPVSVLLHVGDGSARIQIVTSFLQEPPAWALPDSKQGSLSAGFAFPVAKRLAAEAGGSVSVECAGQELHLAAMLPLVAESPKRTRHSEPIATGRVRVLIVDDERSVRRTVARLLRARRCVECEEAASAEEALQLLSSGSYGLLISDVMMPGISGVELAERAAAEHPELRIVLMSGYADIDSKERFDRLSLPLLRKPFNDEGLAEVLGPLLG